MTFKNRLEVEKVHGKCCNSCLYWYTDTLEEPCLGCSGTHTTGFSNWESCKSAQEEIIK